MRRRIVIPGQASLPLAEPPPPVRPEPRKRVIPHRCHVPGCDVSVPPRLLMCRKQWGMVPGPIRRDVWRHFDPAQCDETAGTRPRPTDGWMRAARAAIDAVMDTLADLVVKAVKKQPATIHALEDEPPAGMTIATFRVVLSRLLREKRIQYDDQNRLAG